MKHTKLQAVKKHYELYLFLLPSIAYIFIFCYIPMYGVLMAFQDYKPSLGIAGSTWVGLEHFMRFFRSPQFFNIIGNTLGISLYSLVVGFPFPIILAILLNYLTNQRFKKTVQFLTYAPHFISTVVLVGMMMIILSPRSGIVNNIIKMFGGEPVFFMAESKLFKSIYVWSGIWQNAGWSSIIYIAALTGVDTEIYEAATVDGADKLKRIWYIDLPMLVPTIVILFIMNMGNMMSVGFEKVYLMQNSLNISVSEVVSTYVYKSGLQSTEFSFSAAVGLFNSVINLVLLISVNTISKRVSDMGLW